jgi:16S rRNA pseudouridine516 synthase
MMEPRRIDYLLSRYGYCSRKEVPQWVRRGRVTTSTGAVISSVKEKWNPLDLRIDGEPIPYPGGYGLMLHKPAGYVCSHSLQDGQRVFDLLPPQWLRRDPPPLTVGRLDKDTTGLLLITDSGAWVHALTAPRAKVPKVYEVQVDQPLHSDLIPAFAAGDLYLSGETKPCQSAELVITSEHHATLTLWEGRYHQVKRMFAHFGYTVTHLHRSRFGDYELGDLALGEYRMFPLVHGDKS